MAYSKKRQHRNKKGGKRGSRRIRGGADAVELSTLNFEPTDKLILLIIDPQNDFHPQNTGLGTTGSLAVTGANEDSARIAKLIETGVKDVNGNRQFDQIIVTLDTHNVNHIAHSSFWKAVENNLDYNDLLGSPHKTVKDQGPDNLGLILAEDIRKKWLPKDDKLTDYCRSYCENLEKGENKYKLTIWNHHCIQGTAGHAVVKVIADKLTNWSKATGKTVDYRQKGQNNLTEMYSAIKAEVPLDSDPKTAKNIDLLNALLDPTYDYRALVDKENFNSDSIRKGLEMDVAGSQFSYSPEKTFSNTKVFICGEALDYCVYSTTKDIIDHMETSNMTENLPNLILLTDCTSAINPTAATTKKNEIKDKITFATVGDNSAIVQPAPKPDPKSALKQPWNPSTKAGIRLN